MRWPIPKDVDEEKYEWLQKEAYYAFLENTWDGIENPCCPGWFAIDGYSNPEKSLLDVQEYIYGATGIKVNKDFIWRAPVKDLVRHIYDLMNMAAIARKSRVKRR